MLKGEKTEKEMQSSFHKRDISNDTFVEVSYVILEHLPSYIFDDSLSQLKEISIHSNYNIKTIDPNIFSGLGFLKILTISSNSNLKELPQGIFDDLSSLKVLNLTHNSTLKGLSPDIFRSEALKNSLGKLDLKRNGLTKLPTGIFDGFVNLKKLDLSGNKKLILEEGNLFSSLISLKELNLKGCELTSIPPNIFADLKSLKILELSYNNLIDTSFGGKNVFPSSLKILDLSYNKLNRICSGFFRENVFLEKLDLSDNSLSFSLSRDCEEEGGPFDGLSSLKELYILNNNDTFTSLPPNIFAPLSSLEKLDLSRNKNLEFISQGTFNGLEKSFKKLVLNNNISLKELSYGVFSGLNSLEELDLSGCGLVLVDERVFEGMFSLKILEMSNNESLVELPSNIFLGNLSVREIYLFYNISLKELPLSIVSLKKLKQLHYTGCDKDMKVDENVLKFLCEKKIAIAR